MALIKKREHTNYPQGHKFLPFDILSITFLIMISFINIIFMNRIVNSTLFLAINAVSIYLIYLIVKAYGLKIKNGEIKEGERASLLKIIRYWYPVALILYSFKQVYYIIFYLKPDDWDNVLINADRWLFGGDPTMWMFKFEHPVLTELMQIIYFFYYISIVIYAFELYRSRRFEGLEYAVFIILLGFFLSYIGYMLFPAIGPRFHLHTFSEIGNEMPGIFLTESIRWFLDLGESIPSNVPDPEFFAQRDAMPSAHTQIALVLAYLSFRIESRSFYFYAPYSILMIISTIYLRYHYVIDIFAGVIFALLTILIGNYIYKRSGLRIKGF